MDWCMSPFVRVWGVLTNWLTETALSLLRGVNPVMGEEGRPAHRGRRALLLDLLCSRVPGECSFLARRFHALVDALGVHQTLPPVTEAKLYDFLAALLLRATLRADAKRGALAPTEVA